MFSGSSFPQLTISHSCNAPSKLRKMFQLQSATESSGCHFPELISSACTFSKLKNTSVLQSGGVATFMSLGWDRSLRKVRHLTFYIVRINFGALNRWRLCSVKQGHEGRSGSGSGEASKMIFDSELSWFESVGLLRRNEIGLLRLTPISFFFSLHGHVGFDCSKEVEQIFLFLIKPAKSSSAISQYPHHPPSDHGES